jgi:transposase InsO family protein
VAPHEERQVLALAFSWPTWGPARIADQLREQGVEIAASTVYRLLRRNALGTRRERLAVLEHHSARTAGLLTERTAESLQRARYGARTRHVEASMPGELVCLDSFYVGKLKGVGKVWQLTACDAATSFGMALIVSAPAAEDAARFLRRHVVPLYREAGWPIQRVLTDGGPEYKGAFDEACRVLGIRHTRTKPRHCWTNGFVERLQGTILHEHWRVVFRRRYFTSRAQLQQSLDGFMGFYNERRPHHGYRLRGRTPATAFKGAIA